MDGELHIVQLVGVSGSNGGLPPILTLHNNYYLRENLNELFNKK